MSLRADDGTVLETKEGVVLDQEGHELAHPSRGYYEQHAGAQGAKFRSFSMSLPLPAIIGAAILVPLALAAGLAVFGVFAVIVLAFLVLSWVSRLFRSM